MNKRILGSIAILTLTCTGNAWAAGVGYGIVQYDNDEYFWSVILANHFSQSKAGVTSIVLDSGSSQFATPWVWAQPVFLDGQPAPAASGLGTQSMTLSGLLPTPPSPGNADSFWRLRLLPNGLPHVCCVPVDGLLGVFADDARSPRVPLSTLKRGNQS